MANQLSLGEWAPPLKPELSQYHTPVKLCRRIVKWAGVKRGMRVLEPSAGGGNLVRELVRAGAIVTAVEIDPAWAKVLYEEFSRTGRVDVVESDFKNFSETDCYDMAVMNPPLDGGVGAGHVAHALRMAPKVVSVLRSQDPHGVDRYKELWSRCDQAGEVKLVRRPVYAGAGGQIETIIVDVRRQGTYDGPQSIEFWVDDWK